MLLPRVQLSLLGALTAVVVGVRLIGGVHPDIHQYRLRPAATNGRRSYEAGAFVDLRHARTGAQYRPSRCKLGAVSEKKQMKSLANYHELRSNAAGGGGVLRITQLSPQIVGGLLS